MANVISCNGMVKIGHGSTATDNLVLIDLGGLSGASTPDSSLYAGNFAFRGKNAGNLPSTSLSLSPELALVIAAVTGPR